MVFPAIFHCKILKQRKVTSSLLALWAGSWNWLTANAKFLRTVTFDYKSHTYFAFSSIDSVNINEPWSITCRLLKLITLESVSSCFYNLKDRVTYSCNYLCLHCGKHNRGQKHRTLNSGIPVRPSLASGFLQVARWQNQRHHLISLPALLRVRNWTNQVNDHSWDLTLNMLLACFSNLLLRLFVCLSSLLGIILLASVLLHTQTQEVRIWSHTMF